ncbi:MAG TPA: M23 family metallopeptidase [Verrucomicrobiae bacterium]|nr:M23 family metallopeptidase [Verrucomicrobiae bacterium]
MKMIPRSKCGDLACRAHGRRLGALKWAGTVLLLVVIHVLSGQVESGAADPTRTPPVDCLLEPEEDGKLVYLPIVADTAKENPKNLFGLRVVITNLAMVDLRLTGIGLDFPLLNGGMGAFFVRDVAIGVGQSQTVYLEPDESIMLPEPAPVSVQIELSFKGYSAPKTLQRNLVPYQVSAPGGQYLFPANEADLGPEQYFSHVERHTGSTQYFGYDLHVREWNGQSFSGTKAGGDPSKNEDTVGWNTPIYSMAEGVVLRAETDWEDNPIVGSRVIQRMGEYTTGESIADVKVTRLGSTRAVSAARLDSGQLKLTVWDLDNGGWEIHPQASATGESITELAADALSASRLVTAVRTTTGNLRVILWEVSTNATTLKLEVSRLDELEAGAAKEVSLIKLSSTNFATAVRTGDEQLRLIVWEATGGSTKLDFVTDAFAGAASSISVTALTPTRLVTGVRTGQGTLRLIAWAFNGATLDRLGEATASPIIKAGIVTVSTNQVAAAMRTDTGHLKVIQWRLSDDAESMAFEREVTAGPILDLASPVVSNFSGSTNVFTAVITQDGNYKNIVWRQPDSDPTVGENQQIFYRFGEKEAGPSDRLSVETLADAWFFTGLRTATGNLKVIAWRAGNGGGNNLTILHGNCAVLYAHFRQGTLDPAVAYPGARVARGQFLGNMGNTGRSAGPHTHIHAERVPDSLTTEELLALAAQNMLTFVGYRPIPFHCARAMELAELQPGGVGNPANGFSTMSGHGVYFKPFAIRPTWLKELYVDSMANCVAPAGRKQCVPVGRLMINGPFPTVNQALNTPCWGHRLFIRAGTYAETVTFDRAMTVESYDGPALIGQ